MILWLDSSNNIEVWRYRKIWLQLKFVHRLNKRISFNIHYKIHNLFTMLQIKMISCVLFFSLFFFSFSFQLTSCTKALFHGPFLTLQSYDAHSRLSFKGIAAIDAQHAYVIIYSSRFFSQNSQPSGAIQAR